MRTIFENFQLSLPIPVPPQRTNCDEAQITSLVRALLELSGGRVDVQRHECAQEYTLYDNADLYASVRGVTRERTFGDSDSEQIYKELLESPVILETAITAQDLEEWTMKMRKFLPIGFPKDLVRYSAIASWFNTTTLYAQDLRSQVTGPISVGQLNLFKAYLCIFTVNV